MCLATPDITILTEYDEEKLEKICKVVSKWSEENKIQVSKKTEAMLFTRQSAAIEKKDLPQLKIGPLTIDIKKFIPKQEDQPTIKLLGVLLDPHMNFKAHVKKTKDRVRQRLGQIRFICNTRGVSAKTAITLYKGYVESIFRSSIDAYYTTSPETTRTELKRTQNTALRAVTGCTKPTHIESLLLEANAMSLDEIHHLESMKRVERAHRVPLTDHRYQLMKAEPTRTDLIIKGRPATYWPTVQTKTNDIYRSSPEADKPKCPMWLDTLSCTAQLHHHRFYTDLMAAVPYANKRRIRFHKRKHTTGTLASLRNSTKYAKEVWSDASVSPATGEACGAFGIFNTASPTSKGVWCYVPCPKQTL